MDIIDLGRTDFSDTYRFQIDLVNRVSRGISKNTLLITEHLPIITIGRCSSGYHNILRTKEYLSSQGIEILNVDRGGDVTYHGPGQIIAYPIFKLDNESRDIHCFLDFLEEVGIHFLAQYGIFGERRCGFRGMWVQGKKIGSVGIGVRKWVTYHGIAININLDLTAFSYIRPCGIEGIEMASLKNILNCGIDINNAKDRLKLSFKTIPLLAKKVNKD